MFESNDCDDQGQKQLLHASFCCCWADKFSVDSHVILKCLLFCSTPSTVIRSPRCPRLPSRSMDMPLSWKAKTTFWRYVSCFWFLTDLLWRGKKLRDRGESSKVAWFWWLHLVTSHQWSVYQIARACSIDSLMKTQHQATRWNLRFLPKFPKYWSWWYCEVGVQFVRWYWVWRARNHWRIDVWIWDTT